MNNLVLFGDSFTSDIDIEYVETYKNYGDYHWGEIVAETYDLNLINLGIGSFSNDRIFDRIIENFSIIKEDDVVIIGKTFYNRFDIPNKNYISKDVSLRFTTITPQSQPQNFGFTLEKDKAITFISNIIDNKNFK